QNLLFQFLLLIPFLYLYFLSSQPVTCPAQYVIIAIARRARYFIAYPVWQVKIAYRGHILSPLKPRWRYRKHFWFFPHLS
ncbi:MAG: hypothetical protein J7J46_02720, partial [Candidatus Desulfofervidus sp.]|nr:hypothetical protein [Candidatus Desulfofervidus sp.]